jgi:hypothetical protein
MANIPPLNVKVNIDASGVTVGVNKATAGLAQISSKATQMQSKFSQLKTTMLGVFGGNLLTNAVFMVGRELNAMKQEAQDLQVAGTRLNGALSGIGITSEKVQKSVYNSADAFYQLGFQGSEAIGAMGTLVTATGSVEQAQKLMAISADLARYKHIDMNTAATILARGTQGSARAFKELGITLDTTIPKNQAITKAFDELNKKIGGQAQAYTKTFAGQMDVLKERLDNLFQAIATKVLPILSAFIGYLTANGKALVIYGGIVLSTIAIIKTYKATTMAIKSVQQAYAFWTYAQAASTNVFRFAVSALWTTMKANPIGFIIAGVVALGAVFVWAWNKFDWFRKGVVKGIQIVVNGFGYLVGAVAKALSLLGKIPGFEWAKKASKGADDLAKSVRGFSDSLDELANKKIKTPKIPGFVKPGDSVGIVGNVPGGDGLKGGGKGGGGGSGGGSGVVQNITVYASNTNDIERQMAKAAKNGRPIGAK